jgi:deoxyribodipyrimidine photo-lyase
MSWKPDDDTGADLADDARRCRSELVARLAEIFPAAVGHDPVAETAHVTARGGRAAALAQLATLDPAAYARTRNHVEGAVSRLSPWIRHGVLSLAEVRDAALARVDRPEDAEKLISELGWRDYWRQVQSALGDRIRADVEPPARAPRTGPQLDHVPSDVRNASTGMACIDAFVHRLHDTGWLHNHERMWLASWLVHVRGVHWLAGADWFLEHLLDADPASNHLSWQWVAGTFSAKPYLFNRENLERYTSAYHCRPCPLLGRCDVEGAYEALDARLFAPPPAAARPPLRIRPAAPWSPVAASPRRPLVWLTLDSAAPTGPAAAAWPEAPRLFVIDRAWLAAERPTLKRLAFLFECLADVPGIEIRVGDPAAILPTRAAALGCDAVAVAESPCPLVRRAATAIAAALPLVVAAWPPFCDRSRVDDLGRFSRYWQRVSRSALRPTAT